MLRGFEGLGDEVPDEPSIFWLLVIQAGTLPLQGFLNMFIYNRPNYSRVRRAFPEMSILAAIRMSCFDSEIPKLMEITKLSDTVPMVNKYKCNSSSGGAFNSSLQRIQEASNEDNGSSSQSSEEMKGMESDAQSDGADSFEIRLERRQDEKEGTHKTEPVTDSFVSNCTDSNTKSSSMRVEMDGSLSSSATSESDDKSPCNDTSP